MFQSRKYMLNQEATRNLIVCFIWVIKNVDKRVLKQWWSEMPIVRLNQLLEVLYYAVSNFEYKVGHVVICWRQWLSYYMGESSIEIKNKKQKQINYYSEISLFQCGITTISILKIN